MRSRLGLVAICAAVVSLVGSSTAPASLSTLTVTPRQGPAGTTVVVSGTRFSAAAGSSPIEIRLDSRTSPPIATIPATASFTANVTIPPATPPGHHMLIATQFTSAGNPAPGTPGRTEFLVTGAERSASAAAPATPSGPESPGAPLLAGIALSLALLGAAVKLAGRRRPRTPTTTPLGG